MKNLNHEPIAWYNQGGYSLTSVALMPQLMLYDRLRTCNMTYSPQVF